MSNWGKDGFAMAKEARSVVAYLLRGLCLVAISTLTLEAAAPRGWFVAGSNPSAYESGIDIQMPYNGHSSAFLKATAPRVEGFGTLMQDFRADHYLGKRVRFSAFAKTENAQDWAGLWMRVDKGSQMLSFDNMQSRPIKGTTDWQKYDVVLDVPPEATGIYFGVLLTGQGTVWVNSAKFEVVDSNTPTTGGGSRESKPDEPVNLNFEAN
jgi:hypothetical protein